ncbi:MerR family DNA-binding transcriptional regulator [Paracoccus sp. (in: a-proteobacteria)]|uniref:MerR family transcriptional regulator n=1 Tax=Paracoccus sp. TaxID=267 RepID=UPI002897A6A0|nr:MerR family DNA-binding transcriptional regulator [Paracoccus sp. (in: a-proteobacteria)]
MVEDGYISFKDMCALFDVTPRTLRYYEYIELLNPKKAGRARFYGPREIARMKLIMRGRRFGFSLEDIRQWLMIYGQKGSVEQYRVWIERADRQYEHLAQQRAEIETAMRELRELRDETQKLVDEFAQSPDDTGAEPKAAPEA